MPDSFGNGASRAFLEASLRGDGKRLDAVRPGSNSARQARVMRWAVAVAGPLGW